MVTAELIFHDFEERSKEMSFGSVKDLLSFKADETFKGKLAILSDSLNKEINNVGDLKNFDKEDLRQIYSKYSSYSLFYDNFNDLYYNENYFNDFELKHLFTSITRNLHKIENVSYKYLMRDAPAQSVIDYLKEGLSDISQEAIGLKLPAK